jgi:hypothetical protein
MFRLHSVTGASGLRRNMQSITSVLQHNHILAASGVNIGSLRFGTSLKVLLLEDYQKLGKKGEVIEVKRGHARNLLVPRKIAGKTFLFGILCLMLNFN